MREARSEKRVASSQNKTGSGFQTVGRTFLSALVLSLACLAVWVRADDEKVCDVLCSRPDGA